MIALLLVLSIIMAILITILTIIAIILALNDRYKECQMLTLTIISIAILYTYTIIQTFNLLNE
jgi:hypothetical protein